MRDNYMKRSLCSLLTQTQGSKTKTSCLSCFSMLLLLRLIIPFWL